MLRTPCADLRSACRGSDSWVQESCMAVGNRFNGTGNGRLLLKEKPFGECTHQLSLPATSDFCPNHAPVAADSAAGREGVRSTTMGESRKRTEESLLSSGRFRLSPATGWPGPLPVFIQLTFTPHAAFFGTFLGSKKVPYPPVPPYSLICQNFSKSVNPCNKCRSCIVYISRERGGASYTQRGDRQ